MKEFSEKYAILLGRENSFFSLNFKLRLKDESGVFRLLKIYKFKINADEELQTFLTNAGKKLLLLKHLYAARVYEAGFSKDRFYTVSDYPEGKTLLSDILKKEPMSADKIIPFALKICSALVYAHDLGIYHSNLSADNIFVSDDMEDILITNWAERGIFSAPQIKKWTAEKLKVKNISAPSPDWEQYAPPETALGADFSEAADIYQLGVLLYDCALGYGKFKIGAESVFQSNPAVPKALSDIIGRCVDKEQDARPQSVCEIQNDISNIDAVPHSEVLLAQKPEQTIKHEETAMPGKMRIMSGVIKKNDAGETIPRHADEIIFEKMEKSKPLSVSLEQEGEGGVAEPRYRAVMQNTERETPKEGVSKEADFFGSLSIENTITEDELGGSAVKMPTMANPPDKKETPSPAAAPAQSAPPAQPAVPPVSKNLAAPVPHTSNADVRRNISLLGFIVQAVWIAIFILLVLSALIFIRNGKLNFNLSAPYASSN